MGTSSAVASSRLQTRVPQARRGRAHARRRKRCDGNVAGGSPATPRRPHPSTTTRPPAPPARPGWAPRPVRPALTARGRRPRARAGAGAAAAVGAAGAVEEAEAAARGGLRALRCRPRRRTGTASSCRGGPCTPPRSWSRGRIGCSACKGAARPCRSRSAARSAAPRRSRPGSLAGSGSPLRRRAPASTASPAACRSMSRRRRTYSRAAGRRVGAAPWARRLRAGSPPHSM